ncbi:hypothetical protein JVT61DRAFT_11794 [Boletus reticuloceps]|uniref:DUF6534 domain-containing protein n=1 Tax=Boletus reticuloceps TaxID=495285 RepID=A0A8I2YWI8_9AGAM|nr:hypothetical protein JVT61DRAFT_11794 [Boletus reticuloceps]
MNTASSNLPSPAELENLGLLFIGFVASTVLYGLTFFQTYIYYSRYPRDDPWTRYLVATLCTLDTTATALISEILYYYLIIMFDANMDVLYATTTFCLQYMLSVLLTFISQLFFTHRVFQVTGGSGSLRLILILMSFIALTFGFAACVQMLVISRHLNFSNLLTTLLGFFKSDGSLVIPFTQLFQITTAISLITSVVADVIIFATMCYSLRRARYPEMAVPDGFSQTVVTMLVGRGLTFTIAQMAYFCIFIIAPSKQYWIPLQMVASKLYVNTLLAHLNSRHVRQGQGLFEEHTLTDRKAPSNAPFPMSIRLNVADVKATTQSINLATRNTDTESDGVGLESRKTCQDDRGNVYAHVSTGTGSIQSQTDNHVDKECLSERV